MRRGTEALERGDDPLRHEVFIDVFFDFLGVGGLYKRLHRGGVFIRAAHDEDVRVGGVFALDHDRVFRGDQAGLDGEVRVDDGGVDILKGAGQLSGVKLADLEVLRVLGDVLCRHELSGLDLDQAALFKQAQRAGAVRSVVGDGYLRALLELAYFLDLL